MSAQSNNRIFANQTVVFTGKLASFSRPKAQELVRQLGGQTPPRVTKDTTYLVIGEEGYLSGIVKSNKLKRAEHFNAQGSHIKIIPEAEFLEMAGVETKAALEKKYYSLARIQRLFPRLRTDVIKYFAHWGLFTPAVRTNADQYYEFRDLLTFRRIDDLLANKLSLRQIARRLRAEPVDSAGAAQIDIEFEEYKPKGSIVSLQRPPTPDRTAVEWYEIGYKADGNPETYDQAIEAYENALAIDPDYVEALINLANIYFHRRDLNRSAQLLERAIQIDQNNCLACYNLANIYDDNGELDKALKYYQRALILDPNYEPAIFNIALVYEKLGMIDAAKEHWRKYLAFDRDGEWAVIAREHLMEVGGG